MKHFRLYIPVFIFASLVLILITSSKTKAKINNIFPSNNEGFAVLELFTSQGCSSCPPADDLLGKYAALHNDHIIALAFHVDYWNRLGWIDSFSSAKYSRRQRDYAMIIDHSSVYTPQLVINGEKELVGSDAAKISDAINDALKAKSQVIVTINQVEKKGRDVSVKYAIDKLQKNTTMQAALVQKQVFTNILKGENKGLKLINYNVVRDFNSVAVSQASSTIYFNLPDGYGYKDFDIVLYLQDDASGKIIAVSKTGL